MKQNILLTGASGFLGTSISASLKGSGFNLITLGQSEGNSVQVNLAKEPFKLAIGDQIDIVIHAAGKAHSVPKNEEEEQVFYAVNLDGTINLCKAIEKLAVLPKSFIFISTVAVYGVDSGSSIDENCALNGSTPYAKSKIMAEEWLNKWCKEHDIILSILRLPLIAGLNPPGNLGAMLSGIKNGRYASIGKADARKSMVWADDIAKIVPVIANIGGIYNLTDGYHPTFKELETTISAAYGKTAPIVIPLGVAKLLARVGDIVHRFPINTDKLHKLTSTLTFDDTKARKLLGWKPSYVLDKIQDTL